MFLISRPLVTTMCNSLIAYIVDNRLANTHAGFQGIVTADVMTTVL